jgi:hypothetical protein
MALALADKLDSVYGQEKGRDMGAAIFKNLLEAPWMSSGLPENNAFTTTLVLRLLGFLVAGNSLKPEAGSEEKKFWEPRIEFSNDGFRNLLTKLRYGKTEFSKYLFALLPEDLRQKVKSFLDGENKISEDKLRNKLRIEFDRLIAGASFNQEHLLDGMQLSEETRRLKGPDRYVYQVARINRRILHDAFPEEISALERKSLIQIAEVMCSDAERFKINEYPATAAVVYWFVDGITRAGIPLGDKHWQTLCSFATDEFGRQRSLVVARHMAMMDPVAMAMCACLCARLRRISNEDRPPGILPEHVKDRPTGILPEHVKNLPSAVELESAVVALFNEKRDAGIWPKYFPLFHYQDAGSNFCFTFELLEAVLAEFGFKENHVIAEDAVISGLEKAVTWCKENRLYYSVPDDSHASDLDKKRKKLLYSGWNSGGNLETLRTGLPGSWATAVVYMFLWELIEVLSHQIQWHLLHKYNARSPSSKWNTLEKLLDIDLIFDDKKPVGLIETLSGTILETFKPFKGVEADRLRWAPRSRKPLAALLFGPPGTSKTEVAKSLSKELDWPLVEIDPSRFLEDGFQEIYGKGDEIFEDVEDMCGVVVLFDEMDALVQKRDAEQSLAVESKFLTTYMLPKLAKLHDRGQIVFLMATNFQETFDDAIKRPGRFDLLLCVGPPTLEAKCKFLHRFYPKYEGKDGDADTKAAGERILAFAHQEPWLDNQISLLTFLEFEAFIAGLGEPREIVEMEFEVFRDRVREKADSVLLRMDDLQGVKFGRWGSWKRAKTLSELDSVTFSRESLDKRYRNRPIVRYLLDRKQSRRQYRLEPTKTGRVN